VVRIDLLRREPRVELTGAHVQPQTLERVHPPRHRHRLIALGDVGNFVLPKDVKRFQPAVSARTLRGRDDVLGSTVKYIVDALKRKGRRWDVIAMGNHEASVLQHHALDVTAQIAGALVARHGGYSGYVRYHLRERRGGHVRATMSLLYHHGAWGGKAAKGLPGLREWARSCDGWDIAMCGHNHRLLVDREVRVRPTQTCATSAEIVARDVSYVVCGTHYRSLVEDPDTGPGYEERAGHAPVAIGAPLIQWRLMHRSDSVARRQAMPQWWVEHRVTV
jgi:hypothetical protein